MSKRFKSNPPRPRGEEQAEKPDLDAGNMIRLQKVLATAGHGSRRACEEMIAEGRVEIDGKTCTKLGTRVDPSAQEIRVDGETLAKPKLRYFVVNKPLGVLSTNSDPAGRERVIDLIRSDARLFPIGRLDKSSEGLIIVTNDGELANLLAHPKYGVEKTYLALVAGEPSREVLQQLQEGVHLAEGWAKAKRVSIRARKQHSTLLEIVLDEGRNREVRRLLARVGHKVLRLQRIAQGALKLGTLAPGEYRQLMLDEVEAMKQAARDSIGKPRPKRPRRPKPEALEHAPTNDIEDDSREDDVVETLIDDSVPLSSDDDVDQFFLHIGKVIGDEEDYADDEAKATKAAKKPPREVKKHSSLKPIVDLRKNKAKPADDDDEADDDDFNRGFPVADIADDSDADDDDSIGDDDLENEMFGGGDDSEDGTPAGEEPAADDGPRRKIRPGKSKRIAADHRRFERKEPKRPERAERSEERPARGPSKFGDKKSFGPRKFGDKPGGPRKFGDKKFGDKKPFGRSSGFAAKSEGENSGSDSGERKPYGKPGFKKSFGKPFEKKPYGKPGGGYRAREEGSAPAGDRPPRTFDGKKSFDKPYGKKPFGKPGGGYRPREEGASSEAGERPKRDFGGKKSFGKPYGKPYGKPGGFRPREEGASSEGGERPKREFGGKKSFGKPFEKKPYGKKAFGKPSGFGRGGGSAPAGDGERPKRAFDGKKSFGKPFGKKSTGKPYEKPAGEHRRGSSRMNDTRPAKDGASGGGGRKPGGKPFKKR